MRTMCIAAVATMAVLNPARAWGPEGHSIVAEIAQRHLSPAAASKVHDVLGGNISLASIASWADDARELVPKSYNWHFVDIPLDATNYDPARDCQDLPRGDCVINAIARNKMVLADAQASPKDRQEALKFIVHFIGDVHQPLHTVKDYVGGNEFPVTFFVDPVKKKRETTNLHSVWDNNLIKVTVWDWGAYVTRIEEGWLPGKDVETLSGGSPVDWALAAHKIAVDVAFTVAINADLGEDYLQLTRPQVDQQLGLAGLRLARTLNEILQ
jgi:S1/P1 Nuclease